MMILPIAPVFGADPFEYDLYSDPARSAGGHRRAASTASTDALEIYVTEIGFADANVDAGGSLETTPRLDPRTVLEIASNDEVVFTLLGRADDAIDFVNRTFREAVSDVPRTDRR